MRRSAAVCDVRYRPIFATLSNEARRSHLDTRILTSAEACDNSIMTIGADRQVRGLVKKRQFGPFLALKWMPTDGHRQTGLNFKIVLGRPMPSWVGSIPIHFRHNLL